MCIALHFSVNGQYASQGKLGAAVLANHAANDVSLGNKCDFNDVFFFSEQHRQTQKKKI